MQISMFHNTTHLLPSEVVKKEVKASKQSDLILKIFQMHPTKDFTPFEVSMLIGQQWPITSVRRSITDLTKMGELEKTNNRRMGGFGDLNYCWQCRQTK